MRRLVASDGLVAFEVNIDIMRRMSAHQRDE
jgi:hypothetical protein